MSLSAYCNKSDLPLVQSRTPGNAQCFLPIFYFYFLVAGHQLLALLPKPVRARERAGGGAALGARRAGARHPRGPEPARAGRLRPARPPLTAVDDQLQPPHPPAVQSPPKCVCTINRRNGINPSRPEVNPQIHTGSVHPGGGGTREVAAPEHSTVPFLQPLDTFQNFNVCRHSSGISGEIESRKFSSFVLRRIGDN